MTVPIPSATLVLIRDSDDGIQALLMRRHKNIKFCGGVWVFPGGAVEPVDQSSSVLETAKNAAVRETLEESAIATNSDQLQLIAKWTTPEIAPKRFETFFFVAAADDQKAQADGHEMVDSLWATPAKAIALHRAQEIDMLPPTLVSLLLIANYKTVNEALAGLATKSVMHFLPKVCMKNEQLVMLYPGDSGYAEAAANDLQCLHRCQHMSDGWHYCNQLPG